MNDSLSVTSLLYSEYSDGIDSMLQLKSESYSPSHSSNCGFDSAILQLSGLLSTGLGLVLVDSPECCRTDASPDTSVATLKLLSRDVDFVVLIPLVCCLVVRLRELSPLRGK